MICNVASGSIIHYPWICTFFLSFTHSHYIHPFSFVRPFSFVCPFITHHSFCTIFSSSIFSSSILLPSIPLLIFYTPS